MHLRKRDLRLQLRPDVSLIYDNGLPPDIERSRVPVLAALAESVSSDAYDGGSDYYARVIRTVLQMAIYASAPILVHKNTSSPARLRQGLQELFDVGEQPHSSNVGERQIHAAATLSYRSGDSLRNAFRGSRKFVDIAIDEVTNQLALIAVEIDFSYSGPRAELEDGLTPLEDIEQRKQLVEAEYALKVLSLDRSLYFEVLTLCSRGFEAVSSGSEIPVLAEIAQVAMHTQGHADSLAIDLEAMLTWVIGRIDDPTRRQGTLIYLGLSEARGLALPVRRYQAAPCFGLAEEDFFRNAEPGVAVFIRQQIIALVSELDHWPAISDAQTLQYPHPDVA